MTEAKFNQWSHKIGVMSGHFTTSKGWTIQRNRVILLVPRPPATIKMKTKPVRQTSGTPAPNRGESMSMVPKPQPEVDDTKHYQLANLHLDGNNPRLGSQAGKFKTELDVLDAIVNVYGVDDVLSSLAVNGYFAAEPMVGVATETPGHLRIAEGNRRLAACLILIGDPRAKNHSKRTRDYQSLQTKHGQSSLTEVPVRVLANTRSLLSYLGVRHIAASQPWDSYAKAAWVAKVLDESNLTLEDVSQMIGDQHGTVARSLEGYYFVNQLVKAAQFKPEDSMRPGRGSNPEYPFSWVYTALGYGPVREWLNLSDLSAGQDKTPVKGKERLDEAGELMTFLFGKKSIGRQPAITDSRQISDLAKAISDPQSRRLLKHGKTIGEVAQFLKPAKERVADSLLDAQGALQNSLTTLSEGEVKSAEAKELLDPSQRVRNLAVDVHKKVIDIMTSTDGE